MVSGVNPAARHLDAIYERDPSAVDVVCPAPGEALPAGFLLARRTRGFLLSGARHRDAASVGASALRLPVRETTLTVRAGSVGEPPVDTVLLVGTGRDARRYRLLAEAEPLGDGLEQELLLLPLYGVPA